MRAEAEVAEPRKHVSHICERQQHGSGMQVFLHEKRPASQEVATRSYTCGISSGLYELLLEMDLCSVSIPKKEVELLEAAPSTG